MILMYDLSKNIVSIQNFVNNFFLNKPERVSLHLFTFLRDLYSVVIVLFLEVAL